MPNSPAPERLAALQKRFADHIRDPGRQPAPDGLEDRRMAIYRDLFFRNLDGLLARGFPVLRQLLDDDVWQAMVRDFMIHHRPQSPLFPELPREFLRYLEARAPRDEDWPFLAELAHYEWLEMAVALDTREYDEVDCDPHGDLLAACPVLSPLVRLHAYRFPVHRIRPGVTPREPDSDPHLLLVYRWRDDTTGFLRLNPVAARLVQLMETRPGDTGLQHLQHIAAELQHPDPDVVIEGGAAILEDFRQRDIVPGTRPLQETKA